MNRLFCNTLYPLLTPIVQNRFPLKIIKNRKTKTGSVCSLEVFKTWEQIRGFSKRMRLTLTKPMKINTIVDKALT